MHQQPNSFFSSVNLTTIVKKFCFLILGILGLARASYASNAHSFYYNEQAFEAAMVELSQLEKTVVANENLTLEGLQKLHAQLVKNLAAEFLPWMAVMPVLAFSSYLLDGIFIGATRARAMRDTMLTAVIAFYLPVWWLAQPLGNHGLWLAFVSFTVARSLLLGTIFWREWRDGRWFSASPLAH